MSRDSKHIKSIVELAIKMIILNKNNCDIVRYAAH